MGFSKFVFLVFFVPIHSFAGDPAFACTGRLSSNDGIHQVEINRNVIFDLTGGYVQETLAMIPNFYDVTISARSDGTSQIFVQKMTNGWPETMATYEVGADDSRILFPYSDWWMNLDLRCARIRN